MSDRFSAIFNKGDDFCDFRFGILHIKLSFKRVHSDRKEFDPLGSKFFLIRVDPF